MIVSQACTYTEGVGEHAPIALPVFTGDGQPLDLTRHQRQSLGSLLLDPATRGLLVVHGLDAVRDGDELRLRTQSLHIALGQLWRMLDEAPPWAQRHPLLGRRQLRAALDSANILAATAPREIALPFAAPLEPLALVTGRSDPSDALLNLEAVSQIAPAQLLTIIDEALLEVNLPKDLLHRTLVPLLENPATCCSAARLLGRAQVTRAVPALESALARATTPEARLAILGALIRLGRRVKAFGTLRSILTHGAPPARRGAVELLEEVATDADIGVVHEILRASHATERVQLAGLLYRLGDLRGYSHIDEAMTTLSSQSSSRAVDVALGAIFIIGSRRFIPLVQRYLTHESRPWFVGRAKSVLRHLRTHGTKELSVDQLLESAERAWASHERLRALALLDELLALSRAHARGLYLKANYLKEQGEVTEALKTAQLAVTAAPTDWRVQRLCGSLLWDKGRGSDALEAYDRALKLEPTDPYTWYYKGYVLYRMERHEEALPCLDRALSLKSDAASFHNQKGFCLERLERHEEASRSYRRSLRLAPGDLFTREYLGQALQTCGDLEGALSCFDMVLAKAPGREEALYRRASLLSALERWEEGAAAFARYLTLRTESFNGWFNRGICLRHLSRWAEAATCFEHAVRTRPSSVSARHQLDFCRRQ